MKVSVIVVTLNEEKFIEECLESLLNQNYERDNYEIIISDGDSKDETHEIVRQFIEKYNNIKIVIEKKKGTAAGRNAGVKAARYDYIAFIDGDCVAPKEWLSLLVNEYQKIIKEDSNVIAVGGKNIPDQNSSSFVKAIGIALDSYIGSFTSIQGRHYHERQYVESLANLNVLYKKEVIKEVGYFDESLFSEAEDADLNYRIRSKGYKFIYIPSSYVYHKMRSTPKTWFKNMFRYGKGRARLLKRYPKMWKLAYFFPLLFLGFILLFSPIYFLAIFFISIFQSFKKKAFLQFLNVFIIYIIQHFGYAFGEAFGLLNPKIK